MKTSTLRMNSVASVLRRVLGGAFCPQPWSVVALVPILLFGPANARADDFTFSFTNNVGSVAGTVTGEIFGLTNNSTSAASEVIIDSYPTFPSNPSNLGPAPIDVTAWADQIYNLFTESDGAITYDVFTASASTTSITSGLFQLTGGTTLSGPFGPGVFADNEFFTPDQDDDSDLDSYLDSSSSEPLPGYSLVPASVVPTPEPTSVFLLAGVLLAVAFVARKRMVHGQRSV
jgi:hypothetical protein